MAGALVAGGWGLFAGAALLVGAAVGSLFRVPAQWIALIMAFGSGVLISAVSFDLMAEAYEQGGVVPTACGAVAGAAAYSLANVLLARHGARHANGRAAASRRRRNSGARAMRSPWARCSTASRSRW